MIVVADTTPLNYLILIGHPDVLHALYDKVIVPSAVLRELQHAKAPVQVSLWAQSPPLWLEERVVRQLDPTLPSTLGDGEREAISLGLQLRAELLLMDERIGRVHARARRIPAVGTLLVLLQAAQNGLLEYRDALSRLRSAGFRFSAELETEMLAVYDASLDRNG